MNPMVVIYFKKGNHFEQTGESFYLSETGGVLPAIGDLLIDPGVTVGQSRTNPKSRIVREVISRYFIPGSDQRTSTQHPPHIILVVKERTGNPDEVDIFSLG
ncbi:hypothetical protein HND93_36260 [Azospirillum sp. ROY-1-1-2]|uniref:Uncharacterized protein n=2 Tax=Azospirillum oleiclasticum TaxID=2735135 RepID=A0ABX2TM23_9PROT|nr:hypothetical protein [Azospirillum oleiclasticum]NYZ25182.1 hypothetical protein [Azospirillum oleiclasticum]